MPRSKRARDEEENHSEPVNKPVMARNRFSEVTVSNNPFGAPTVSENPFGAPKASENPFGAGKKSDGGDVSQSSYWNRLAINNGGQVDGCTFSKKQCYEKMLEADETGASNAEAWRGAWAYLYTQGGAHVNGKTYSKNECIGKAASFDATKVEGWFDLAQLIESTENNTISRIARSVLTSSECYIKVLELNPLHGEAWFSIGHDAVASKEEKCGPINGVEYDAIDCIRKALEINSGSNEVEAHDKPGPTNTVTLEGLARKIAWGMLSLNGGGTIGGKHYTAEDCVKQSDEVYVSEDEMDEEGEEEECSEWDDLVDEEEEDGDEPE